MDFSSWTSWAQALLSGVIGAVGGGLIAADSAARAVKTQFTLTARESQRLLEMGKLEEVIRLASTLIVELDELQTAVEHSKLSPAYRASSSYSLVRTIVEMYLPELASRLTQVDEALAQYYGSLDRVDQFWRVRLSRHLRQDDWSRRAQNSSSASPAGKRRTVRQRPSRDLSKPPCLSPLLDAWFIESGDACRVRKWGGKWGLRIVSVGSANESIG